MRPKGMRWRAALVGCEAERSAPLRCMPAHRGAVEVLLLGEPCGLR